MDTNRRRNRLDLEYELLDTGVFDDNRYFDVFVEYAKAAPEEILIRISAWNRGPEPATLHLLPTLWFRNTWSWSEKAAPTPTMRQCGPQSVSASHPALGNRYFLCDRHVPILFTDNETNRARVRSKPKRSNCTS